MNFQLQVICCTFGPYTYFIPVERFATVSDLAQAVSRLLPTCYKTKSDSVCPEATHQHQLPMTASEADDIGFVVRSQLLQQPSVFEPHEPGKNNSIVGVREDILALDRSVQITTVCADRKLEVLLKYRESDCSPNVTHWGSPFFPLVVKKAIAAAPSTGASLAAQLPPHLVEYVLRQKPSPVMM